MGKVLLPVIMPLTVSLIKKLLSQSRLLLYQPKWQRQMVLFPLLK